MLEESARLTRLVDSLLTIARADSGQIQLEKTTVPLVPLVRDVTSLLDVLAEEKSQKVSVAGDDAIQVQGDGTILRQVLTNLLDNAIKYSYSGSHISLRVSRSGDGAVVVEVEDDGPGIPPEHRDKVFDRFYRIDKGRSRDMGGAGLALAIAKWGAEAHGGHLRLFCSNDTGCTFRLVLPQLPATDAQLSSATITHASESADQPSTSLANLNVSLVVSARVKNCLSQ